MHSLRSTAQDRRLKDAHEALGPVEAYARVLETPVREEEGEQSQNRSTDTSTPRKEEDGKKDDEEEAPSELSTPVAAAEADRRSRDAESALPEKRSAAPKEERRTGEDGVARANGKDGAAQRPRLQKTQRPAAAAALKAGLLSPEHRDCPCPDQPERRGLMGRTGSDVIQLRDSAANLEKAHARYRAAARRDPDKHAADLEQARKEVAFFTRVWAQLHGTPRVAMSEEEVGALRRRLATKKRRQRNRIYPEQHAAIKAARRASYRADREKRAMLLAGRKASYRARATRGPDKHVINLEKV